MDYSINFSLVGHQDFGSAPVEWHQDAKVLEFGDAPYSFYDWVDDRFGYSEDDSSPRVQFLDAFFDALHQRIDELNMATEPRFTLEVQGLKFNIEVFKD